MNDKTPTLIADIEARIEELADQRLRVGKAVFLSRIAMWAGVALLVATLGGFVLLNRTELGVLGLGLAIGGLVIGGSSQATARELTAGIGKLESARAEAIDRLDLEFVSVETPRSQALH